MTRTIRKHKYMTTRLTLIGLALLVASCAAWGVIIAAFRAVFL